MLTILVLGSAAGGGLPQWNCGCDNCRAARADPTIRSGQMSLAVSADERHWFLINASPDLRQQITETPELWPEERRLRHSPIAGVILTNGEVDALAGLLTMREGTPFSIHAHPRVLETLASNSIFNVLASEKVARLPLEVGRPFGPALPDGSPSGLSIEAFDVPGKVAWYLEQGERVPETQAGDTVGLTIRDRDGATMHVVAACAAVTSDLAERLDGADLLFFDGTLWRDDEMITMGLAQKTGQRMGHVSISGAEGVMANLGNLRIGTRVFVHINNSNPVLKLGSVERQAAEEAGWIVPQPGRKFKCQRMPPSRTSAPTLRSLRSH